MFNFFRRKRTTYRKDTLQVGLNRTATVHYSKTETGERLHVSLDDGNDLFFTSSEVKKLKEMMK